MLGAVQETWEVAARRETLCALRLSSVEGPSWRESISGSEQATKRTTGGVALLPAAVGRWALDHCPAVAWKVSKVSGLAIAGRLAPKPVRQQVELGALL